MVFCFCRVDVIDPSLDQLEEEPVVGKRTTAQRDLGNEQSRSAQSAVDLSPFRIREAEGGSWSRAFPDLESDIALADPALSAAVPAASLNRASLLLSLRGNLMRRMGQGSRREGPSPATKRCQRVTGIAVQPLSGSLPLTSRPAMIRQEWPAFRPK